MGKLMDDLKKQLKTENKQDATDCIKIYNKLLEINEGKVWDTQWNTFVKFTFAGTYPNSFRVYKLNEVGKVFLKGIETAVKS